VPILQFPAKFDSSSNASTRLSTYASAERNAHIVFEGLTSPMH